MRINQTHVLVTGASRGIGQSLALELASRGARLTLVARGREALEKVAADTDAVPLPADLGDPSHLAGLVARAEREAGAPVDVVVSNAGVGSGGRFEEMSPEELRSLWDVNVAAGAELARQALPGMLSRRRGRLVFVSSLSASVALPGLAAYSASKAAVSQLADGLRAELAGTGVGTTLVELGPVVTDMYDAAHAHAPTAAAFDRARRLGLLKDLDPAGVASSVVNAIERDRDSVVLPRRGRLQFGFSRASQRLSERLLPQDR